MGSGVGLDPVFLISSVIGIHLLQRPFCMCTCRMQDVDMLTTVLSNTEGYLYEYQPDQEYLKQKEIHIPL